MVLAQIPSRVPPGKIQPRSQALSSASLGHWKKGPCCGWSCDHPESGWLKKYAGQEGWQSVLIVVVRNFVGFKTSSSR